MVSGVTVTKVRIGPAEAEHYLGRNHHNRALNHNLVDLLARQMQDGSFLENGDTIRISNEGVLLDGQHRLSAIIKSQTEHDIWLVTGLEPESQMTMDQQRRRSAGDALNMAGVRSGTAIAALVRAMYRWDLGERSMRGFSGSQLAMSVQEVVTAYNNSDDDYDTASKVAAAMRPICQPRATGMLYLITQRLDPQRSDDYFAALRSGANLHEGHPALTVRNYWTAAAQQSVRSLPGVYLAAGIRGWNALVTDRDLLKVTYKTNRIPEPISPPRQRRTQPKET